METCRCELGLGNTGTPNCQPLMRAALMVIVVPKFDSTGARNFIDTTDTLDQAYFYAKVNAADPADRWYPLPKLKNAESTRAEPQFEDFADGDKAFVHQGIRPYTFLLPNQTPQLLKQLEDFKCTEFGVYIIDRSGNLIGSESSATATELYPILVNNNTWVPQFIYPTDTTVPKISVTFNFDLAEQDSNLRMILASELTPVNLLNLTGLIDVYATYSAISTTGFTAKLYANYGTALNRFPVKGLVITDFVDEALATSKVYNVTDSASVALTSVTESPDGTYTFVFAAQTSGDKIKLHPVKTRYDFTAVLESLVTIP